MPIECVLAKLFLYTCCDLENYQKTKDSFTAGACFSQLQLIIDLDLLEEFKKFATKHDIKEGTIYEILD